MGTTGARPNFTLCTLHGVDGEIDSPAGAREPVHLTLELRLLLYKTVMFLGHIGNMMRFDGASFPRPWGMCYNIVSIKAGFLNGVPS